MKKGSTNWAPRAKIYDKARTQWGMVNSGLIQMHPGARSKFIVTWPPIKVRKIRHAEKNICRAIRKAYVIAWQLQSRGRWRPDDNFALMSWPNRDINMAPGHTPGIWLVDVPRGAGIWQQVVDMRNLTPYGRVRENLNKLPRNHREARRHSCMSQGWGHFIA